MNESKFLTVEKVDVTFPTPKGPLTVLEGASFDVARGEVVALIGHSGCGKSTLLNVIAGLHTASRGGVILEGREVTEPGPDRAMVFQTHALLPWLSAYDNVRLAVDRVFGKPRPRPSATTGPCSTWNWCTWRTPPIASRPRSQAACASGWALPGRWPCSPRCC